MARLSSPPPFIRDRSLGAEHAARVDLLARDSSLSVLERRQRIRHLFAEVLSPGRAAREFPRGLLLDPMRRDVRKVMTSLLRANQNNWGGYFRELKYINSVSSPESPLVLAEANSRRKIAGGRLVEFDLVLEERRWGLKTSVEVKEWHIRSSKDLANAKEQIANIGKLAAQEGVRPIWINRNKVGAGYRNELRSFARRAGFGIYDHVTTGDKQVARGKASRHFDDVLAYEARLSSRASMVRVGGKALGGAAVVFEVGRAGFIAWKWHGGGISTREAAVSGSGAVGGAAGGAAGLYLGMKSGAAIGTLIAPGLGTAIGAGIGGFVFGVGGAIAGDFAASKASTLAMDKLIFQKLAEQEKQEVIRCLRQHYQVAK